VIKIKKEAAMIKRYLILTMIFCGFLSFAGFCQEQKAGERLLVLREAEQQGRGSVAVEAYFVDGILEVTVEARTNGAKPIIENTVLVGPKLGRLSAKVKRTVYAREEEEGPFLTKEAGGLLGPGEKKNMKKLTGTLSRELYKFKIPNDMILPGKDYELRIAVGTMQESREEMRFEFTLKGLAELMSQQKQQQ